MKWVILILVLMTGCAFMESVMYEQQKEKEVKPVIEHPMMVTPIGCEPPYEAMIDDRCCIEYNGEYVCDLDYEVYSICAKKHGVTENVIFYHTEWCMGCEKLLDITKKIDGIYLSNKDDDSGIVVDNCYGHLIGIGLPKFICVKTGEVGMNIDDADDIKEFYESCPS